MDMWECMCIYITIFDAGKCLRACMRVCLACVGAVFLCLCCCVGCGAGVVMGCLLQGSKGNLSKIGTLPGELKRSSSPEFRPREYLPSLP